VWALILISQQPGALQCCAEVLLYVQNICEGASSPDSDVVNIPYFPASDRHTGDPVECKGLTQRVTYTQRCFRQSSKVIDTKTKRETLYLLGKLNRYYEPI
jgi:hypothetical protein